MYNYYIFYMCIISKNITCINSQYCTALLSRGGSSLLHYTCPGVVSTTLHVQGVPAVMLTMSNGVCHLWYMCLSVLLFCPGGAV